MLRVWQYPGIRYEKEKGLCRKFLSLLLTLKRIMENYEQNMYGFESFCETVSTHFGTSVHGLFTVKRAARLLFVRLINLFLCLIVTIHSHFNIQLR